MWILLWLTLLHMTQGQEIILDSLDNGPGLLPFRLGPTRIISHYHSFINYIDLENIHLQVESVKSQMSKLAPLLNNKTRSLFDPHLKHLNNKIAVTSNELSMFESVRRKRGLIDGLGSVIKSISGNLDYTDALKYEHAINILRNNEHKLETELNSRVSLNKEYVAQSSIIINDIVSNQVKINNTLNLILRSDTNRETDLIKYAHMAQHLLILGDNIEDLYEEMQRLENTLSFIRASSTSYSIFSLNNVKEMIGKLRILYSSNEVLDVEFRQFYEIIKLGYFYSERQVVIVIKVPIVISYTYDLYKLSVVPNKNHKVLIPISPFLAISGKDSRYIETECPKLNSWFLCTSKPDYKKDKHDCIQQLITHQELNQSCPLTSVVLQNEALEQLDDKHYTMSFPTLTKVKLFCGQEQYRTLQGSYVATIPLNCYLKAPGFTITNVNNRIKGHIVKILEIPQHIESKYSEQPILNLASVDLNTFHSLNTKMSMQPPVHLNQYEDISLYHTTIPLYIVLVITIILVGIIAYRRMGIKSETKGHPGREQVPEDPSLVKVNPGHISSATLSNKVLE
ncbi:uncharacterized protein LOC111002774 [Pieris rapae]|uniref:uncharacterized protein LOC111002774 n=1 Tax=Pieris rapae TaxID=64459 RepID=UPI001E27FB9C|nr:uncharacterized protein LOC111002774 [Pieris rapae]